MDGRFRDDSEHAEEKARDDGEYWLVTKYQLRADQVAVDMNPPMTPMVNKTSPK